MWRGQREHRRERGVPSVMPRALALALVLTGCAGGSQQVCGGDGATVPGMPFEEPRTVPEAPETWLDVDRDVIMLGQVPSADVYSRRGPWGDFRIITEFDVIGPDQKPVARACTSPAPTWSRGSGSLDFSCVPFDRPGVYTVRFDPARLSWPGQPVEAKIRVLDAVAEPQAPDGWVVESMARRPLNSDCIINQKAYEARLLGGALQLRPIPNGKPQPIQLPSQLIPRMSAAHSAGVKYVFSVENGWLVLLDRGEFGGGVEWYQQAVGPPQSIIVGEPSEAEQNPQNVVRAVAKGDALYVLQGLSHLGLSAGQLAVIWPEHGHFMSRVIARYASAPVDWIPEPDGSWTVVTWEAVWHTSASGSSELVARLPGELWYPYSLTRTDDGTLFVGSRGGVLRLTPAWEETPRYQADFLMPEGSRLGECGSEEAAAIPLD